MCCVSEFKEAKVANKEIIVYKVFAFNKETGSYFPPFYSCTSYDKKVEPGIILCDKKFEREPFGEVIFGLHSYEHLKDAIETKNFLGTLKELDLNPRIAKCKILPSYLYFKGKTDSDEDCYCSNKLQVEQFLEL
jgi:hypothetical protein